jgi:hypothetical protein
MPTLRAIGPAYRDCGLFPCVRLMTELSADLGYYLLGRLARPCSRLTMENNNDPVSQG